MRTFWCLLVLAWALFGASGCWPWGQSKQELLQERFVPRAGSQAIKMK